jgi:hypothetical protein
MYCKIIEEDCREPLGDIQFEKNGKKTKWKGNKVFLTLGWSRDFPRSVENSLGVLGTG